MAILGDRRFSVSVPLMDGYTVDRRRWPPGEWDVEPDRKEWRHAGLPCLALRSQALGAWCGYVAVPPGHRLHGLHYDDVFDRQGASVPAHGGLTYSGACSGHVCHVPLEGEPANVWWLGFDCGHAYDHQPGYPPVDCASQRLFPGYGYRPLAYVIDVCNALADSIALG